MYVTSHIASHSLVSNKRTMCRLYVLQRMLGMCIVGWTVSSVALQVAEVPKEKGIIIRLTEVRWHATCVVGNYSAFALLLHQALACACMHRHWFCDACTHDTQAALLT
jgi:hypothetical protein